MAMLKSVRVLPFLCLLPLASAAFAVVYAPGAPISTLGIEASAQNMPPVFQRNDRDGDGRLSKREFPGPPQVFDRLDADNSGYLTPQEVRRGGRRGGSRTDAQGQSGRQQGGQRSAGDTALPATTRKGPLRFVDTHIHLHQLGLDKTHGNQGGGREQGRREPMDEAANLAAAARNLIARMDQQRLQTALIVVVPSSREGRAQSYHLMRNAVRDHPGRLRLLAGGSLLGEMLVELPAGAVTDDVKQRFRKTAEKLLDDGAAGFGEMISYHLCMNPKHKFEYVPPNHPLFLELADIAAEQNVAIDLHMEAIETRADMPGNLRRRCSKNPGTLEPTIPGLEELLRHNRKARIVWEHIGWDNTGQMTPSLMRRLLQSHTNLYLSLRVPRQLQSKDGRVFPNRIVDLDRRIKPDWLRLITEFPDRIMLGADEFVGPGPEKAKLAASFESTWAIIDQLPEDIAAKIGGDNARRVFNLTPP